MQVGHTEIIHEMEQHIRSAFRAKSFVVSDPLYQRLRLTAPNV